MEIKEIRNVITKNNLKKSVMNKLRKKSKEQKGITLINLIITIIIMLILAGVAILVFTNGEGLFNKTQIVADMYSEAVQNEAAESTKFMNEVDIYLNSLSTVEVDSTQPTTEIDSTEPATATIESSNIEETTFTLTAIGEDETGIAKYEFYINDILEKTLITVEEIATYNVTEKTAQTTYTCKVRVFDGAGNYKDSNEISVTTKAPSVLASSVVQVGDYINYNAGIWTSEDLAKITSSAGSPTLHSTVNDAISNNQGVTIVHKQFGGFELGQSRDTNSREAKAGYKPRTAGWRVWDIDSLTGEITLISAGHPETYFHGGTSSESINILKNRNCEMYENIYAKTGSAHILTGQEAATWYNKQYGTNYTIVEWGSNTTSTFCIAFSTQAPIGVLEIGSYYWLASVYNRSSLYNVRANTRSVSYGNSTGGYGGGVRILVSLKSDVRLEQGTEDGSVNNPWKIVEN